MKLFFIEADDDELKSQSMHSLARNDEFYKWLEKQERDYNATFVTIMPAAGGAIFRINKECTPE